MEKKKVLEVKDLSVGFVSHGKKMSVIRNISLDVYEGETLAIVGESGSGKSVTSKAIMGILANNSIIEGGLNMSHTFVNIFTLFAFYTPSSF